MVTWLRVSYGCEPLTVNWILWHWSVSHDDGHWLTAMDVATLSSCLFHLVHCELFRTILGWPQLQGGCITEVAVKRGSIIYHLAYWFMARWNSIMDVEIVSVDSVQGCLIWQWSTVSRLTVVKGVSVDSDQGCLSWQWSMVSRLTMVKVVSVNSGQGCLSWQWSTVSRLTMVKVVSVDSGQGCLSWP